MKRTRREIYVEILTYCSEQTARLKTRIMNYCSLNYTQVNEYVPTLIKMKLLEKSDTGNPWHPRFLTTNLGKRWLTKFMLIKNLEGGEKKHE